jgi:hypothetical protein
MQARIDGIRAEFAGIVAKNRGLPVDAVMATEAQVYSGKDSVAVGFADRIGTFQQLMQHIAAGAPAPVAETQPVEDDAATDEEPAMQPAAEVLSLALDTAPAAHAIAEAIEELQALAAKPDPLAALASAVAASKLPPSLGMALLKHPPANMEAEAAIAYAAKVRDLCAAAGVESLAGDLVAAGASVESARAQLLDLKADTGPEIATTIPQKPIVSASSPRDDVYRRRAAAAAVGQ